MTPIRGSDKLVFAVTGSPENVAAAKAELSASVAEFDRREYGRVVELQEMSPGAKLVTSEVRVPKAIVALVMGRKAETKKSIERDTHTVIGEPHRDEEPIFVVTGTEANVARVRDIILNKFVANDTAAHDIPPSFAGNSESVEIEVRVPKHIVRFVVGRKSETRRRIEQDTETVIREPFREHEPIFVVSGTRENVEKARKMIQRLIEIDARRQRSEENY